jgi:hypothetical protein
MIDKLLERKVTMVDEQTPFIAPRKMLLGDRLALLIFLRVTMDNIYRIEVDGQYADFDLTTLKLKEINIKPNENNEFDFLLPKSKKRVTFRLMTGEDEIEIRMAAMKMSSNAPLSKIIRLERLITSVDGEKDKMVISAFVKQMNIVDANNLIKYMSDVTPSFDLDIEVISPVTGKLKKQSLELTSEFFFPSIYRYVVEYLMFR